MSKKKNIVISALTTLVFVAIAYYFLLPPINITSFSFWFFIFISVIVFSVTSFSLSVDPRGRIIDFPKVPVYALVGVALVFAIIIVVNIVLSPIFHAGSYASRINVNETANFTEDIPQVNFSALPLLDKDSSQKLGDRVMGQMPELVSQFSVSGLYTQINYNDKIVRVTPLEYADWIKYFSNRNEGIKGYITVDSVTGESKLTKLDKGMKYVESAMFNEKLSRHLRFAYPTEILGEEQFEIDNEGNPYWIVPTINYVGVGLKTEISGVIIVDPITGDMKKYKTEEVPTWVDHVYSASLIIEQVDQWGEYRGGFFNSIFGQKNVVQTTSGYNYTVLNDDVYLYTGLTSAVADEANLGFILTNMRTKETKFYAVPGAEENSAMASAVGQVQQMNYSSTFPLLINLNGKPTYLVSLKDNAGLVKMYAYIDVADYQKVVVTDAAKGIEEAAKNYLGEAVQGGTTETRIIKIANIKEASLDGTTFYYFIDTDGKKYKLSLKVNKDLIPFIKVGDSIEITHQNETEVTEINTIKMK